MKNQLVEAVKAKARDLGFDLVGITRAEPSAFAEEYREWIARGYAGEMAYLERNLERRLDPRELLADARSIIVVGMNYYTEDEPELSPQISQITQIENSGEEKVEGRPPRGDRELYPQISQIAADASDYTSLISLGPSTTRQNSVGVDAIQSPKSEIQNRAVFARYARGDDYHDVMTPRLRELLAFLKAEAGEGAEGRVFVDTGPVLEREVARRAGLGWFGKNTMLINTRRGSYFFLGEIVTNVALPVDVPAVGGCGTCTRCIDACPTGAITAPYALDACRCISYLTIELKGAIPEDLRPALAASGNRIYGCDICQEVCPFNRPAAASAHPTLTPTAEPAFQPRPATTGRTLAELTLLSEEDFREQFRRSPVKRAKWRGLIRNVEVATAFTMEPELKSSPERCAAAEPELIVRKHAHLELEEFHNKGIK